MTPYLPSRMRLLGAAALLSCACSTTVTSSQNGNGDDPSEEGGPDFGPEGQAVCPTPRFCLDFPMTTLANIEGISATSAKSVWAVGSDGTILLTKTAGAGWVTVPSATAEALHDVVAFGWNVFVVGAKGTILTLEGDTFRRADTKTTADFTAVWGTSANDVWAVGTTSDDHGVVLHWDGATWSHVDDDDLPRLAAVHGTSADDVWVGGGTLDDAAVLHLEGGSWKRRSNPVASARQTEGPIAGLYAQDGEVFATTRGVNFSNILRLTGDTWKTEADLRLDSEGDHVRRIVRDANGDLWTSSDPLRKRGADGKWEPATDKPTFGAPITALAAAGEMLFVGGAGGLLGDVADTRLLGPWGGIASAKSFADGSSMLHANDRVLLRGPEGGFTSVGNVQSAGSESIAWANGNSASSIAFLSMTYGADYDDPNREAFFGRWDGTTTNKVWTRPMAYQEVQPWALTASGDVIFSLRVLDQNGGFEGSELLRLGASAPTAITCNGQPTDATYVLTAGDDVVVYTNTPVDGSSLLKISGATCTPLLANDVSSWEKFDAVSANDVWTLSGVSNDITRLGHFDGATFTEVAKPSGVYCSLRATSPTSVWLAPCGDPALPLLHWNGTKMEEIALPPSSSEASYRTWKVYGTDDARLFVADDLGRIFKAK